MWSKRQMYAVEKNLFGLINSCASYGLLLLYLDLEKRKNPVCGFVTPLEGSEADSHGKPEVSKTHVY